jgi:queuosine precursor transporter
MIGNLGTVCIPNGPCLIPVGFGLMAPSGVLMIGLALVLRDVVHRALGGKMALLAIGIGTIISYFVADPALVLASVLAFSLAELLNQSVYAPLYRRRLMLAVVLSSVVGTVSDSVLFLWVAFGSLEYMYGQIVGKLWAVGTAAAFLFWRVRAKESAP